MPSFGRILAPFFALLALAAAARGQERPLRTADPVPLPHAHLAVEAGVDWLDGVSFLLSGLSGDLLRVPSVAFRYGLGGLAEFQVAGGFNLLFIDDRQPAPFADMLNVDGDIAHDIDDPVVAVKIRLHDESQYVPDTGFRVATRLPSAGNQSGLGNDTMDFLLWVLAGKTIHRTRLLANVGLGVLAVPERGHRQNDVLLYGLAATRPLAERWTLAVEVNGRRDLELDTPAGTDDMSQGRLGLRWNRGAVVLDTALVVGLHRSDPTAGATLGMTWVHPAAMD